MARGQGMDLPGIDTHWNVDDPAASERAFRTLRHGALASGTTALRAELLTQFDRAHDVRGAFEAARSPLDEAAALVSFADRRARTRHLLESGRLLTRADDPAGATPLFPKPGRWPASGNWPAARSEHPKQPGHHQRFALMFPVKGWYRGVEDRMEGTFWQPVVRMDTAWGALVYGPHG